MNITSIFLQKKIKKFDSIISKNKNINSNCKILAYKKFGTSKIAKHITESLTKKNPWNKF